LNFVTPISCLPQRHWRLSDEPIPSDESDELADTDVRARTRCNIFLGYTSNLISSGLREIFLYLVKHKHVACIVTTAGGIEEDFIKCLGKTYLAEFSLDGADLRRRGMNRIGNLIVPNDNYCKFEDWLTPILDAMLEEQKANGVVWTPSSFIRRLGKEIDNEESVYYWAYKVSTGVSLRGFAELATERYSRLLSSVDGWFNRGYDLFPFVQVARSSIGHRRRHPSPERTLSYLQKGGHDHPRRRCLQAPDCQCDVNSARPPSSLKRSFPDSSLAKWGRLFCVHRTHTVVPAHLSSAIKSFGIEYRPGIRRFRFWRATGRGRFMGENPRRC
jgi:Deoxyhypusine synthase